MTNFTTYFPIGILIGISIGISIGIAIAKRYKPWSEMTKEEKRFKKILLGTAVILLVIGVLVNLWFVKYY